MSDGTLIPPPFRMQASKRKNAATDALVGLWTIAMTAFVIATLYLGRDILIPLALSALLTFLLSPVITWLGRWIGRVAAVLLTVAMIFGIAAGAGLLLTRQLMDLATNLPQYKDNISSKIQAFHGPNNPVITKVIETFKDLEKEAAGNERPQHQVTEEAGQPETAEVSARGKPPMAVEVVNRSQANPMELVKIIIAPLLGPIGTAALVLILVITMLLEREDLRSRLIRLIGQENISTTTHAMDDAGKRVSQYLLLQLLVNVVFGSIIAVGLYFIGLPNALLWGALGTVFRFIPYVGPWVATVIPTTLALATSPGWTMPVLTLAIIVGPELILSNFLEPRLYGARTGVSSIALIVAAVFWTWLWGPIGLVLTTPSQSAWW